MIVKKLLRVLGELTAKALHLVWKLCGALVTIFLHAFIAGTPQNDDTSDKAAQEETDEYATSAADHHFKNGWES